MPHCIASASGGGPSITTTRRFKMLVNFDPTCNAHSFPETEDTILSRLAALHAQECGPYKRSDYLRRPTALSQTNSNDGDCAEQQVTRDADADQLKLLQKTASSESLDTASTSSSLSLSSSSSRYSRSASSTSSSSDSSTRSEGSLPIDAECRSVMISWYHQVLDHCSFARENGGIAAYLLDMYLSQQDGGKGEAAAIKARIDRREFQLVSMTALFLAIKMNECETITVSEVKLGEVKTNMTKPNGLSLLFVC